MSQIEILLNPKSLAHAQLEKGIQEILDGLSTVKYVEKKQAIPPGTLTGGWDQVIAFTAQHPDKAVVITAAILNAISNLLRWTTAKSQKGKSEKPVIIVVENQKIALPATEPTQKKFLKKLEGDSPTTIERGTHRKQRHKKSPKPRRKKRTR